MSPPVSLSPRKPQPSFGAVLYATPGAGVIPFSAQAAAIIWSGSSGNDFALPANWSGGALPGNDLIIDVATFSGSPTASPDLSAGDYSVSGLDFQSGGWTLTGSSILSIGSAGISATGDNEIAVRLSVANPEPKLVTVPSGDTLELDQILASNANRGSVTIDGGGTVVLSGGPDNPYFSPTIASGTTVLNKGSVGGTGNAGSAVFDTTVSGGATLEYGLNSTDRGNYGQISGTATVNGTLDLKADGTVTNNWNMAGLSGNGMVTNTGSGNGRLGVKRGNFSG